MKRNLLLIYTLVAACHGLTLEDQQAILEKEKITADDVASILEFNGLIPDGTKPVEYASFLLNGDKWDNIAVKEAGEFKHMTGTDLRDNLSDILEAAKLIQQRDGLSDPGTTTVGAQTEETQAADAQPTTVEAVTEIVEETTTTTTVETTTTFNEADLEKSGSVELVINDIAHSPHMMHWSPTQQALYIADIWALRHIRFAVKAPETTTVAPTTTPAPTLPPVTGEVTDGTTLSQGRNAEEVTTDATVPDETTVIVEEATTAAPESPFDIRQMQIDRSSFFPVYPEKAYDKIYPAIAPVFDVDNVYNGDVAIAVGNGIYVTSFDDEDGSNRTVSAADLRRLTASSAAMPYMHIMSAAWTDPKGRLITGSYDVRPLIKRTDHSAMCLWDNVLDCDERSLKSVVICHPAGLAFSKDNSTLYIADSYFKSIFVYGYDIENGRSGSLTKEISLFELLEDENATPAGLATDENGHIWMGVNSRTSTTASVIEVNPKSEKVISAFEIPDPEVIDVVFAGEELDFIYVLTKTDIYNITGMGVSGAFVPDFNMIEYE